MVQSALACHATGSKPHIHCCTVVLRHTVYWHRSDSHTSYLPFLESTSPRCFRGGKGDSVFTDRKTLQEGVDDPPVRRDENVPGGHGDRGRNSAVDR